MSWIVFNVQGHELKLKLTEARRKPLNYSSRWLTAESPTRGDVHIARQVFANPVRDVVRYRLKKDGDWFTLYTTDGSAIPPLTQQSNLGAFFDDLDREIHCPIPGPKIAVLLESPHENEFDADFNPLGPARGPTGESFHRCFTSHVLPMLVRAGLSLDCDSTGHHVFLINPVPYQASLHHLTNKSNDSLKNAVWKTLWTQCKNEFMDRLRLYKPEIILNGCTADLKDIVTNAIKEHEYQHGTVQHYNVAHPSQWKLALPPFEKVI